MGIHCEINLHKPTDGAFKPGSTVAGTIKYALDAPTVFKNITISLKGSGRLAIKRKQRRKNHSAIHTFRNHEDYIHLTNVIHNDEKGSNSLPIGCYETHFSFVLPEKIPSSLSFLRHVPRYIVRCYINYYLSIKFERPSIFKFDKKFKKEITVISGITPTLPTVPTVCGEQKTLSQLFSSKKSVVDIKATVQNCVIATGGKVNFTYEVRNDTNVIIKGVETKLVEKYTFTGAGGRVVHAEEDVKNTDFKTGSIKAGEVQEMPGEIQVPSDRVSLENSRMVTREYFVRVVVNIPFPHRDAVLNIPLQIGDIGQTVGAINGLDAPPSYWEVMAEDSEKTKDDDDELVDEESEEEKN